MATYFLVNLIVMLVVIAVLCAKVPFVHFDKRWLSLLIILLIMTAIFDNFIVSSHIVAYDSAKISGIYIGTAPIEDFMYSILAAIIIPSLWNKFNKAENT